MNVNPYAWTDDQIRIAVAILGRHSRIVDALPDIAKTTGRHVTEAGLKHALKSRGLGSASVYLGTASGPGRFSPKMDAHERASAAQVAPQAPAPQPAPEKALERLLAAVRGGPVEFEALCDRLDMAPKRLRALVDEAKAAGFKLDDVGTMIGRAPGASAHASDERQVTMPAQPGGKHSFLVASDIHIGSKHHLADQLEDFVERAYARGVRVGLCPGDLLDGVYRHSVWEQTHRGFDEQCREAARSLPKRPGFTWHFCLGNHDQTFEDHAGLDVGRAIVDTFRSEGRTDWHYHGSRGAYLRLNAPGERGIVVELWHPAKGGGYALSYKMQNHIRDYAVGYKPDALLVGHWHQQCYFVSRGVHAMSCGTWQGGRSSYGKSLGGSPSIGGWVVEYTVTKDGTIREFCPTWNAYYENEHARDIVLGEAMGDYTGL